MKYLILILIFLTLFSTANFAQNEPVCPTLHITGPSSVTMPGETATYSASLIDGTYSASLIDGTYNEQKVRYNWSVDQGKIIEGQGTTVISVSTVGLEDTTITATVEVIGLPCGNLTDSETIIGDPPPQKILIDRFSKVTKNEIKEKLIKFAITVHNNPSDYAYIINCGSSAEIADREKIVKDFIMIKKLNAERFIFLSDEKKAETQTSFFLVPVGSEPPNPDCSEKQIP